MPHPPAPAVADDQPRLEVVARGKLEELVALQEIPEPGQRAAREQRLLLPVAAQELRRRQAGKTDFRHAKQ